MVRPRGYVPRDAHAGSCAGDAAHGTATWGRPQKRQGASGKGVRGRPMDGRQVACGALCCRFCERFCPQNFWTSHPQNCSTTHGPRPLKRR